MTLSTGAIDRDVSASGTGFAIGRSGTLGISMTVLDGIVDNDGRLLGFFQNLREFTRLEDVDIVPSSEDDLLKFKEELTSGGFNVEVLEACCNVEPSF